MKTLSREDDILKRRLREAIETPTLNKDTGYRSSSRSTVTTCHYINHVTKRPTPLLDKDSVMESKACVANKFSILGFTTSFGFKLIMYF